MLQNSQKNLAFTSKLSDLFDVAVEDAISKMSNQEDIKFLTYQRMKGRPGHMEGIDVNTALAEQRREARKAKAEEWRWRQISPVSAENVRDISLSSESEVEEITSDEVFTDDEKASKAETASKKRKYSRGYKEVITSPVVSEPGTDLP
ncbi:uncharacterized protein LOC125775587 [Bactrocera dorsalis]|uniref:Uncharacterized protein LOC125775586 n=1 Tax=Bactrocera dorsalis TaxID=27457 RepID=A0ABM3IYY2_BACDO|nr:uncharacterized protein LOC125775586 [Bactrocera dorsalis]XP_049302191.1 uncharacterized protein LOC125775587 [Bactrocera dorsalis]